MSASFGAATTGSRPELITATYRRLRRMGFDNAAAANLTAFKNGIGICSRPWAVSELTHLLFLRELGRSGRQWSDGRDRADSPDRAPASAIAEPDARQGPEGRASAAGVGSTRRDDHVPTDDRVTLLTLFRAITGSNATLGLLHPATPPRPDTAGGADREGG